MRRVTGGVATTSTTINDKESGSLQLMASLGWASRRTELFPRLAARAATPRFP
jgi:hypothetical protein